MFLFRAVVVLPRRCSNPPPSRLPRLLYSRAQGPHSQHGACSWLSYSRRKEPGAGVRRGDGVGHLRLHDDGRVGAGPAAAARCAHWHPHARPVRLAVAAGDMHRGGSIDCIRGGCCVGGGRGCSRSGGRARAAPSSACHPRYHPRLERPAGRRVLPRSGRPLLGPQPLEPFHARRVREHEEGIAAGDARVCDSCQALRDSTARPPLRLPHVRRSAVALVGPAAAALQCGPHAAARRGQGDEQGAVAASALSSGARGPSTLYHFEPLTPDADHIPDPSSNLSLNSLTLPRRGSASTRSAPAARPSRPGCSPSAPHSPGSSAPHASPSEGPSVRARPSSTRRRYGGRHRESGRSSRLRRSSPRAPSRLPTSSRSPRPILCELRCAAARAERAYQKRWQGRSPSQLVWCSVQESQLSKETNKIGSDCSTACYLHNHRDTPHIVIGHRSPCMPQNIVFFAMVGYGSAGISCVIKVCSAT